MTIETTDNDNKAKLTGLDGWLILVGINLYVDVLITAFVTVIAWKGAIEGTMRQNVENQIFLAVAVSIVCLQIYLLYLFHSCRKRFISLYMAYLVLTFIFTKGLVLFVYMWFSKRVKYTFVN